MLVAQQRERFIQTRMILVLPWARGIEEVVAAARHRLGREEPVVDCKVDRARALRLEIVPSGERLPRGFRDRDHDSREAGRSAGDDLWGGAPRASQERGMPRG